MRRSKVAALLISISVVLASCGTTAASPQEGNTAATAAQAQAQEPAVGAAGAAAAGETGSTAVQAASTQAAAADEEEVTVTVVIPSNYVEIGSQEEADKICTDNGYESVRLEEDGSMTIIMRKSVHDELLRDFGTSVEKGISELSSAKEYPGIVSVTHNDDYSEFTVTVEGDSVSMAQRLCADELVMYGTLYHVYAGNDIEKIVVTFISKESGETLDTAESAAFSEDGGKEQE